MIFPGTLIEWNKLTASMAVTDTLPIMIKEIVKRQGTTAPAAYTYDFPTSPLQQFGFAIIFFFPALATIFYALRVYSRTSKKQFGLGAPLLNPSLKPITTVC